MSLTAVAAASAAAAITSDQLFDELQQQLREANANLEKARRRVRKLERDLDDHKSVATVAHRFVAAWDGPGPDVVIDAATSERADLIRGAIRLMRQFCAEHPEAP